MGRKKKPHLVKCLYCGETFDAQEDGQNILWVKPRQNRYAHIGCYQKAEEGETQEQKDIKAIFSKAKTLEGTDFNFVRDRRQLENIVKRYGYNYGSILKTLVWFYEIKNNKPKPGTGCLGIVPYVYQEAYNYYYNLYVAQNNAKQTYYQQSRVVEIKPPQKREQEPKLFDMDFQEEE